MPSNLRGKAESAPPFKTRYYYFNNANDSIFMRFSNTRDRQYVLMGGFPVLARFKDGFLRLDTAITSGNIRGLSRDSILRIAHGHVSPANTIAQLDEGSSLALVSLKPNAHQDASNDLGSQHSVEDSHMAARDLSGSKRKKATPPSSPAANQAQAKLKIPFNVVVQPPSAFVLLCLVPFTVTDITFKSHLQSALSAELREDITRVGLAHVPIFPGPTNFPNCAFIHVPDQNTLDQIKGNMVGSTYRNLTFVAAHLVQATEENLKLITPINPPPTIDELEAKSELVKFILKTTHPDKSGILAEQLYYANDIDNAHNWIFANTEDLQSGGTAMSS